MFGTVCSNGIMHTSFATRDRHTFISFALSDHLRIYVWLYIYIIWACAHCIWYIEVRWATSDEKEAKIRRENSHSSEWMFGWMDGDERIDDSCWNYALFIFEECTFLAWATLIYLPPSRPECHSSTRVNVGRIFAICYGQQTSNKHFFFSLHIYIYSELSS